MLENESLLDNMNDLVYRPVEKVDIKCPYCGKCYYSEDYNMSTAMYTPVIIKDGKVVSEDRNIHTTQCTCLECGEKFKIVMSCGKTKIERGN